MIEAHQALPRGLPPIKFGVDRVVGQWDERSARATKTYLSINPPVVGLIQKRLSLTKVVLRTLDVELLMICNARRQLARRLVIVMSVFGMEKA